MIWAGFVFKIPVGDGRHVFVEAFVGGFPASRAGADQAELEVKVVMHELLNLLYYFP